MPRKHRATGTLILVVAFTTAALSVSSCAINEIGLSGGGSGSGNPPATCTDGIKNGDETDNDCGGSCTETCTENKTCNADSDCSSTFCNSGVCVAHCNTLAKDGDETDVDCGGSCTTKCSVGRDCKGNADCFSDACNLGACVPTQANLDCGDLLKNGFETDVDCGGGACPACGPGKSCLLDSDCVKSLKCDPTLKSCQ